MKKSGNCGNCARGINVKVNSDILCSIHGIVSRDFRCSRYIRKVMAWYDQQSTVKPATEPGIKCLDCEYFVIPYSNKEHNQHIGYCQLFTVRHYNGRTKNACSKFTKRIQHNIS